MNAGPGSIAGAFVHERHGKVDYSQSEDKPVYRNRLSGWYGGDQVGRFNMDNKFRPSPGASGYQVSNPSAIDLASLCGALSVFTQASMADIRKKAINITAYLEHLLYEGTTAETRSFRIITPSDVSARGTQLSVLLKPGRLETLSDMLDDGGIVVDKRKPDVIRVAPVPLYNTYEDVWNFVQIFKAALAKCE